MATNFEVLNQCFFRRYNGFPKLTLDIKSDQIMVKLSLKPPAEQLEGMECSVMEVNDDQGDVVKWGLNLVLMDL